MADNKREELNEIKTYVGTKSSHLWELLKFAREELAKAEAAIPSSTETITRQQVLERALKVATEYDPETFEAEIEGKLESISTAAEALRLLKDKHDSLEMAVKEITNRVSDAHGIEVQANDAAALVHAKELFLTEMDAKGKELLENAQQSAAGVEEEAKDRAEVILETAQDRAKEIDEAASTKRRDAARDETRRAEEWEYEFKRECKAKIDNVNDQIKEKAKIIAEREDAVSEREGKVEEYVEEIATLRNKIEADEMLVLGRIEVAADAAKKKAETGFGFAERAIRQKYDAELIVERAKNEHLTAQLADMNTRLARAEAQVSDANERVTKIATEAMSARADAATISEIRKMEASSGSKK